MSKMKYWAVALLLPALFFGGCSSDDGPAISVIGGQEQSVWADEVSAGEIRFTASSSWRISVLDPTSSEPKADWLWLEQDGAITNGGAAGDQTLQVVLSPNWRGRERKAVITVKCDNDKVEYTVNQSGKTKAGRKLKAITSILSYSEDGDSQITFGYDSRSRVSVTRRYQLPSQLPYEIVAYAYEPNKITATTTVYRGVSSRIYSLDGQGRVVSMSEAATAGNGENVLRSSYVYNKDGYLTNYKFERDYQSVYGPRTSMYDAEADWVKGNPEKIAVFTAYSGINPSPTDYLYKNVYTDYPNVYNIDVASWFSSIAGLEDVQLLKLTGRVAANLLRSTNVDYITYEMQQQLTWRYVFDEDDYVKEVYVSYGEGGERLSTRINY